MRILGIDPGLRTTGFGVIDTEGAKLHYVASGTIKTDAKASLPTRLGTIHAGLCELVAKYQPDQAVVEIVFVNVNPQSTLLLGQARGAALTALVSNDLDVAEYTALQMKKAIVGLVMTVEDVEGSFKLNQHKSDADHTAVTDALAQRHDPGSQEVARMMRAQRPHLDYKTSTAFNISAD